MDVHLFAPNVVIAARQFNPSVMSQLWLVKNGLLEESDFLNGCIFTDELVQVRGTKFGIVLVPQQLQFFAHVDRGEEQDLIVGKVGSIVRKLPHTPFSAAGLNFFWQLKPENSGIKALTRQMFFREGNPIYRCFDVADARFGAYLSKDMLGCRLKTDIKPVIIEETKEELLQFAFNFHLDLNGLDDPVSSIVALLQRWDEARTETENIVRSVEGVID